MVERGPKILKDYCQRARMRPVAARRGKRGYPCLSLRLLERTMCAMRGNRPRKSAGKKPLHLTSEPKDRDINPGAFPSVEDPPLVVNELDPQRAYHLRLVEELRRRLAEVKQGGPEESRRKHREAGKLLARERIERLLDPGSPFLETSPLAAWGLYDGSAPSAGIITGI